MFEPAIHAFVEEMKDQPRAEVERTAAQVGLLHHHSCTRWATPSGCATTSPPRRTGATSRRSSRRPTPAYWDQIEAPAPDRTRPRSRPATPTPTRSYVDAGQRARLHPRSLRQLLDHGLRRRLDGLDQARALLRPRGAAARLRQQGGDQERQRVTWEFGDLRARGLRAEGPALDDATARQTGPQGALLPVLLRREDLRRRLLHPLRPRRHRHRDRAQLHPRRADQLPLPQLQARQDRLRALPPRLLLLQVAASVLHVRQALRPDDAQLASATRSSGPRSSRASTPWSRGPRPAT